MSTYVTARCNSVCTLELYSDLASFPGPAQLSVACSTEKRSRAWSNSSRERRRGREKGREDLIERRRIVDEPTHVVDRVLVAFF